MRPLYVRLLARLCLAITAIVCALAISEALVRVWYATGQRHELEFTRYSLLFKQAGPSRDLPFEHRPGMSARLMGVSVRTNEAGLRADRSISERKDPGTFRIACVGDSLTFGWGVPEEETYCARLGAAFATKPASPRFRAAEAINFGVGNYNTVMELETLRRKVFRYDPDVVVVQYYINDAEPVPEFPGRSMLAHSYLAIFLWARVDLLFRQSGLREDYVTYYRGFYDGQGRGFREMQAAITQFAEACRTHDVPAVAVIFPELHRLDDREPFQDIYAAVERMWRANGVPVVNLWEVWKGRDPSRLWVHPADVHPNGVAQGLAAEAIEPVVRGTYNRSEGRR